MEQHLVGVLYHLLEGNLLLDKFIAFSPEQAVGYLSNVMSILNSCYRGPNLMQDDAVVLA